MASLQSLKIRIRSVESTQKVTKAMKMIAASYLHKTHSKAALANDLISEFEKIFKVLYDEKPKELCHAINNLFCNKSPKSHYLSKKKKKARLFMVFTSDRGLCGQFNTSVTRAVIAKLNSLHCESSSAQMCNSVNCDIHYEGEGIENVIVCIGKRGYAALKDLKFDNVIVRALDHLMLKIASFSIDFVQNVESNINEFTTQYDLIECFAVYNAFISVLQYNIVFDKLWPISYKKDLSFCMGEKRSVAEKKSAIGITNYEPNLEDVLGYIKRNYLRMKIYSISLSSMLSEYSARMVAMENANKNSQELIARLTKKRNKIRQESITNELIEIIAGVQAV